MLTINRIEILTCFDPPHDDKRPLRVHFTAGDETHSVDVSGGELQKFERFQARVLSALGVLVRHDDSGRPAAIRHHWWLDEVQHALCKGREESAA